MTLPLDETGGEAHDACMRMTRDTNVATSPAGTRMDLVTMTEGKGFRTIPANWFEITDENPELAGRGERLFLVPSKSA